MKIKKNDNVIMLAGKDKGKKGKILRVFIDRERVVVEGLNMLKRHQRARKEGQKGEVIEIAAPVHVSNVALLDPKDGKPTRIGFKVEGDKKIRISKRSGQKI